MIMYRVLLSSNFSHGWIKVKELFGAGTFGEIEIIL